MASFQALFFDFDGLILDTEDACYAAWSAVFRDHGQDYRLEDFQSIVGTDGTPRTLLEKLSVGPLDWDAIDTKRREHENALGANLQIKPGVLPLVESVRARGGTCAVVSSSPYSWVEGHLKRRDAYHLFDGFVCRGDAPRVKPAPDLYLEALRRFEIDPEVALVFEDSYNGSLAAKRAGIRCVAVPNDITRTQDFSHADLVVSSLAEIDLDTLAAKFRNGRK